VDEEGERLEPPICLTQRTILEARALRNQWRDSAHGRRVGGGGGWPLAVGRDQALPRSPGHIGGSAGLWDSMSAMCNVQCLGALERGLVGAGTEKQVRDC
jgi:hypothetical protein